MENPFKRLEPSDGYNVVPYDLGELEISLCVGVRMEGEIQEFLGLGPESMVTIWERKVPDGADRGARERARLLSEAICRYFNTGGSWDELEDVQRRMQTVVQGGLVMPGWDFFDAYVDTEGNYTSTYLETGGTGVVRWVEGQFVDMGLTLEDLSMELDNAGEAEEEVHTSTTPRRRQDPETEDGSSGGFKALPGPMPEG